MILCFQNQILVSRKPCPEHPGSSHGAGLNCRVGGAEAAGLSVLWKHYRVRRCQTLSVVSLCGCPAYTHETHVC